MVTQLIFFPVGSSSFGNPQSLRGKEAVATIHSNEIQIQIQVQIQTQIQNPRSTKSFHGYEYTMHIKMVEEETWWNIASDVEGLGSTAEQRRLKCRRTLVGRMPVNCAPPALTY